MYIGEKQGSLLIINVDLKYTVHTVLYFQYPLIMDSIENM